MTALLLALALAAPAPAPAQTPSHTGFYTLRVGAGQTRAIEFGIPTRLATENRPLSFTWRIIRPVPAPKFVFIEYCVDPERCLQAIMQPTGQSSGTQRSAFRIINKSALDLAVEIRFALW
ncbi:MAG TPA: hypothetical protein VFM39_01430 [bacterium]|nr:hypothetical protein [bacterium]